LCIFAKWEAKKDKLEFKYKRVILLVLFSLLCASPFVFLSWFFWPLETKATKLLPLFALAAALYAPPFVLILLGYKIKMGKPKQGLSSEEIFDIVNERDEVVGQAPRKEVHARGLWHRAVHVLVFNARGEVFLQKRSMLKDTAKGKWDSSSSGHLDTGENYDTCAVREVREEIGLHLTKTPQRLFKIDARQETGWEFCWIYRCESEGPFVLHPDELETGAWFAPDAVTKWVNEKPEDFASAFVLIWKTLITTNPKTV
jgi:isopentenyldiphosphate isomerase